jgi:branched-subunit amino acid aminotransferase/4-amino-4-deoxychorismate lyase
MKRKTIIFIDGKFIQADPLLMNSLTPGVLKAVGVFETMRIYHKVPFAYEKHFLRMVQGLHILKVPFRITSDRLCEIVKQLIKRNHIFNGRLRVQIWKDKEKIHLALLANPLKKSSQKFYRATVSEIQQNKSFRSHVKTLDYAHFRQALLEARAKGFQEAILLNKKKQVVEGAHTNIFVVKNGVIHTPAIGCGCLNGITRDLVMSAAKQLSIPFKESLITLAQLKKADEIFLANSIIEIKPLIKIEDTKINNAEIGPITQKISRQLSVFVQQYLKVKKSLSYK